MLKTKGEALVEGIEKICKGLEMVQGMGDEYGLMRNLVGSLSAARRVKEIMASDSIFGKLVISLTAARVSKLKEETVEKVVEEFLDVPFDLSKPYEEEEASDEEEMRMGASEQDED